MIESKKKPICICFEEAKMEELKKHAHYKLMSVSEFLRLCYDDWVKRHKNDKV